MKLKSKYIVSVSILLVVLICGATGHVILTKTMIENEHQEEYQGMHLGELWSGNQKFQPRQYIKVVPVKQRQNED
ncbi:hypothetical protein ACM26V_24035 [Salipaludibacillus sp. HK11]|uniref:hypothetical protein n=1 Tax=Salipaludibacillus sp. HK11 TaxID=3394320 RepID=UPI0039FDB55D